MGGVYAVLGEEGDPELEERLNRMLARSPYRGNPEKLVEGPVAIGIQTLGWDASLAAVGNWIVAFHGYVGNWDELAAERSRPFGEGASDAERFAVAYEDLGDRLFPKLRGEWSVLLWDRAEHTLTAVRDVFGLRPMCLGVQGNSVVFASEPGAVSCATGKPPRPDYLYIAARIARLPGLGWRTLLEGVEFMPPATVTKVRRLRGWRVTASHQYWNVPPPRRGPSWGPGVPEEMARELGELIVRAVQRSLGGVERVGLALSGGLDSSGILAAYTEAPDIATELAAVTMAFPGLPSCDETGEVERVARCAGVQHVFVDFRPSLVGGSLRWLGCLDTPPYETAFLWLPLLSAVTRSGTSVVLTGTEGDRFFYGDYGIAAGRIELVLRGLRNLFGRMARRALGTVGRRDLVGTLQKAELAAADTQWPFSGLSLRAERQGIVSDLQRGYTLAAGEQIAARFHAEFRAPYCDLDLVEWLLTVPVPRGRPARKALLRAALGGMGRVGAAVASREYSKVAFDPVFDAFRPPPADVRAVTELIVEVSSHLPAEASLVALGRRGAASWSGALPADDPGELFRLCLIRRIWDNHFTGNVGGESMRVINVAPDGEPQASRRTRISDHDVRRGRRPYEVPHVSRAELGAVVRGSTGSVRDFGSYPTKP